jgi:hypothetical protein
MTFRDRRRPAMLCLQQSSAKKPTADSRCASKWGSWIRAVNRKVWVLPSCFVILLLVQLVALRQHIDDQHYLHVLVDRIVSTNKSPSEQVLAILGYLRHVPAIENSSYFLLPIFRVLRPPARSVAEQGGDCADRARLVINLLHLREIHATKWALYSADNLPQHAAVEVEVEAGKMVVDALFGLYFPHPRGGYYGIQDLMENGEILDRRIADLREMNVQPGVGKLEYYPLDKYRYEFSRTINWNKSIVTKNLYKLLRIIVGSRIDSLSKPYFFEVPALMVIYGIVLLQGFCVLVGIRTAGFRKKW